MVSKKTGGIVLIAVGVLFLIGAIFMHMRYTGNQETYDDNEAAVPGYAESPAGQDAQDTLDTQERFRMICGVIGIIPLILGAALFVKFKDL